MIKQIAKRIEQQIKAATGAIVEWTFRDETDFTIDGDRADVEKAVAYVSQNGIAKLENIEHDDELMLSFAYLTK